MQRYVQAQLDRQKSLVQNMVELVRSAPGVPETPDPVEGNGVNSWDFKDLYEGGGVENAGFESAPARIH